jgi:hypothetical protein
MLPLPFEDYIPQILRENMDAYGQALCDYINNIMPIVKKETVDLRYFYTIELIPAKFLDVIGKQLTADIRKEDTEKQKRIKILYAMPNRAKRSLWELDIKPTIDSITGLSASLVLPSTVYDDAIICGDGTEPLASYWFALGCDGVDDELGVILVGAGDEIQVSGNVYIDVGGYVTPAIVSQIIANISTRVPAYYRIILVYFLAGVMTELGRY